MEASDLDFIKAALAFCVGALVANFFVLCRLVGKISGYIERTERSEARKV